MCLLLGFINERQNIHEAGWLAYSQIGRRFIINLSDIERMHVTVNTRINHPNKSLPMKAGEPKENYPFFFNLFSIVMVHGKSINLNLVSHHRKTTKTTFSSFYYMYFARLSYKLCIFQSKSGAKGYESVKDVPWGLFPTNSSPTIYPPMRVWNGYFVTR